MRQDVFKFICKIELVSKVDFYSYNGTATKAISKTKPPENSFVKQIIASIFIGNIFKKTIRIVENSHGRTLKHMSILSESYTIIFFLNKSKCLVKIVLVTTEVCFQ